MENSSRQNEQLTAFRFENVEIFQDDTNSLGIGSYGAVFRAKCDDLPCAAKILHPILFQSNDPASLRILQRFMQECVFMSNITHPNIVQFLGSTRDPQSDRPVLLMELLDESLTKFLERSLIPIPYHIEISLAHDIALALAYLHSNHIIHRDLSSNNVLIMAGCKAKVTDFGMSKLLGDDQVTGNRRTATQLPGTDVYMPPECVRDHPVYDEKIDIFSFGVLLIQIMTRMFPSPTERISDHDVDGFLKLIPERERRKEHIDHIEPTHPLLEIAFECLRSNKDERPYARDICRQIATLKAQPRYIESTQANSGSAGLTPISFNQAQQIEMGAEELHRQVEVRELRNQISDYEHQLGELRERLNTKDRIIVELHQRLSEAENICRQVTQSDSHLQKRDSQIKELQRELRQLQMKSNSTREQESQELAAIGSLNWQHHGHAPTKMVYGASTVHGDTAYIRPSGKSMIYEYNRSVREWRELAATCQYNASALAYVEGHLTTIGGREGMYEDKNNLLAYTNRRSRHEWKEYLPPMTQCRSSPSAVCNDCVLVVAGGMQGNHAISSVEVLDLQRKMWHKAENLSHPLSNASVTICNERLYLVGGWDQRGDKNKQVFSCEMHVLDQSSSLSSSSRPSIWKQVAPLSGIGPTCSTVCKRLIAVGGLDKGHPGKDVTNIVHVYDPLLNIWKPTSHIATARFDCFLVNFDDTELLVIGGYINHRNEATDSMERALFENK